MAATRWQHVKGRDRKKTFKAHHHHGEQKQNERLKMATEQQTWWQHLTGALNLPDTQELSSSESSSVPNNIIYK